MPLRNDIYLFRDSNIILLVLKWFGSWTYKRIHTNSQDRRFIICILQLVSYQNTNTTTRPSLKWVVLYLANFLYQHTFGKVEYNAGLILICYDLYKKLL